jgi:hypothetical protein
MDTIDQIRTKLAEVREGTGVQIEGLPNHFAYRFTSGNWNGDWIGVAREHGSWPLTERNLKLAELDALHKPTRIEV